MKDPVKLRLGRHMRIVRKGDFDRAYQRGTRARGSQLLVVATPNGLEHPRIGLSVGRSIWRDAVKRNRVRRVFREAFRLEQHALPVGFDLVLIPARPKLEPDLAGVRRELVELADRAARAKPRPPRAQTPRNQAPRQP